MPVRTRTDILELFPKHGVGAEIGVFEGQFSELIRALAKPNKLYLVDPFTGRTTSGDKDGLNIRERDMAGVYWEVCSRYEDHPEVEIVKSLSHDWLWSLPDGSLDFIYIDGDHSYEGVKGDLLLARDKVRKGGIIAGHDYSFDFPGVMKAVDQLPLKVGFTTDDRLYSYYMTNL